MHFGVVYLVVLKLNNVILKLFTYNDADVIANLCLYFNCESDKLNLLIRVWLANLHNLK